MYADDTSLTLSAYDPTTLEEKLNKDLDKVQKWLKSNKLTLNVKKTKYVIIGSHYRLRHLLTWIKERVENDIVTPSKDSS